MFPFLIIAYSTTNGPAPSEAAGPAPMAPNRWAWKKWINSASLIAAPWLRNRNLENRDFIIQVFQALNSRRLASSDREPSARVEILPALARAPSHSMCLVATRKTPATASVNANFKFVPIEHVGFPCLTKLSAASFLFALTEGLLLAFSGLRWKLFEHFCHAPIEVLFILRCTIRKRAFGAAPPN
jgi:hypothetical protein